MAEELLLCQLIDHVPNKHDWAPVLITINSIGYSSPKIIHDPIHDYNC